jgi:hypothetical protein
MAERKPLSPSRSKGCRERHAPERLPEPPRFYLSALDESEAASLVAGVVPDRVRDEIERLYCWSLEDVGVKP